MQRVFEALSSQVRRKILAYLAHTDLTAGEIAARFEISKPAVSQHLTVLENAGLVTSEKKGQYVHSYAQEVCPVSKPLKAESAKIAKSRKD
jgi:DNA-binding transcriptional ArsR family regulator